MPEISPREWLASVISTAEADGNSGLADVARRTLAELDQARDEYVVVTIVNQGPMHVYGGYQPLTQSQANEVKKRIRQEDREMRRRGDTRLLAVSTHHVIRSHPDGTIDR